MKVLGLIFMIAISLPSLTYGQKRVLREAAALESQGRHEAAFGKYVEAMHHNSTKSETRDALVNSSKKVMDLWLSQYFVLRNSEATDEMFALVAQIEKHEQQLKYFGLKATMATHYKTDFETDKNRVLAAWYTQATAASDLGNYEKAQGYFSKIIAIETDYKDAATKSQAMTTAPIFAEAQAAYQQKQITRAWQLFGQLKHDDPNFNKARQYKERIAKEHAISMTVLPAESGFHSSEYKLRDGVVATLSQLNSPFIQLIDRENLTSIIEEQKLGLSGLLDQSTAAKVGQLAGVKAVLFTKLMTYYFKEGDLQVIEKVAYQGFRNNGLTEYQSTDYSEYLQTNALIISLNVQLIDSETGKVLYADVVNHEQSTAIHYAQYDGNYQTLYPAEGEFIHKSGEKRRAFLKLFMAKKEMSGWAELDVKAQKGMAQKVAIGIEDYFNTK